MSFASNLRRARLAAEMTHDDLGKACGLSRQVIWSLETGRISSPRADTAYRISMALGVPLDTLMEIELVSPPAPATAPKTKLKGQPGVGELMREDPVAFVYGAVAIKRAMVGDFRR